MKPKYEACEKCGLREVRHELEKKGVTIRFCEECYWGELEDMSPETAPPQNKSAERAAPGSGPR
ncbi:MAG TPA: hypothetical protein VJT33_03095 [bacterium]|nr:hypothetical protein [bacterium]